MSIGTRMIGGWPKGGIAADVDVATPMGWRAAKDLVAGDPLRLFDGGVAPLRTAAFAPDQGWLRLPKMVLGNRRTVVIAAAQGVLLRSPYIAQLTGEPMVVVPARALIGWRGVQSCPAPAQALILRLERPHVIMVGAGAYLTCPGIQDHGWDALPPVASLSLASARQGIACMIAYEAGLALRPPLAGQSGHRIPAP